MAHLIEGSRGNHADNGVFLHAQYRWAGRTFANPQSKDLGGESALDVHFYEFVVDFDFRLADMAGQVKVAHSLQRRHDHDKFLPDTDRIFPFVQRKKLSSLNTSILLYFLLKENKSLQFIFHRALLNYGEIEKTLKNELDHMTGSETLPELYGKDVQETLQKALQAAQKNKRIRVEKEDLLPVLAEKNIVFSASLIHAGLMLKDILYLSTAAPSPACDSLHTYHQGCILAEAQR